MNGVEEDEHGLSDSQRLGPIPLVEMITAAKAKLVTHLDRSVRRLDRRRCKKRRGGASVDADGVLAVAVGEMDWITRER